MKLRAADPPMQFVAEEDAAGVFCRSVRSEISGIFNVAGDGVVRLSEIARANGRKVAVIPAWILYPAVAAAWSLRLAPFNASILDLIRYTWVADNTRLKTIFGYTPRLTSRRALDSCIAAHGKKSLRAKRK